MMPCARTHVTATTRAPGILMAALARHCRVNGTPSTKAPLVGLLANAQFAVAPGMGHAHRQSVRLLKLTMTGSTSLDALAAAGHEMSSRSTSR
jgi:hypothetical protein